MITRNTRELSNDYEEREYNRINFCIRYNLKVEKTLIAKLFFLSNRIHRCASRNSLSLRDGFLIINFTNGKSFFST